MPDDLIRRARQASRLSQAELAQRAKTSRPTLSAYEHGQKSPTLATARRIIEAAGSRLEIEPRIEFSTVATARGRTVNVPDALPRLTASEALATVVLPLHLNWSDRGRSFNLADRRQRARAYEVVLREGMPEDILAYIDGALLVDLWQELTLPREVRRAWEPLIRRTIG